MHEAHKRVHDPQLVKHTCQEETTKQIWYIWKPVVEKDVE